MDNKMCAAAVATIEAQLEILKSSMGLSPDTGEEYEFDGEPQTKQVGRGRKKKTVPTIEEDED